jgi:hypothetical protein
MARDPNKFREDMDLDETDDQEEEDFDGRPEQSVEDEDNVESAGEPSRKQRAGKREKSPSGRRYH